ncbi:SDR family NAD(P)-dependent oxidoreductase [Nocardia sp. NPDC024068]|uniref:SDR family NAD(P)-dependent oxidoreductase n=1 Tax=Nocardia sp. NPDC024068 TaxID=3157197 RepID=UPI0033BFE92D
MEIDGASAVVTGASGGLGGAIARTLHARGARLVLTGRRREALESLASELNGADIAVCDLADRRQVVDLASHLADADIVVANAALPATGKLEDFTSEQLDRALDVNLRAPMLMTQLLLPGMLRRGRGHFVYVSSIGGKLTMARTPLYAATKFGLRGFCASLRQDLHGSGVSASVVFPGSVRDVGFVADAHLPLAPGSKGVSSDVVARSTVTAIERDRGEVDAAELPARIMAKLAGVAPEFTARLGRRKAIIAWGDQVAEGLRHHR